MLRSHYRQLPVKLLLSLAITGSPAADGPAVDYFADNGFGNPSSTIQHPTGEHYKGTTYIAYQGPHEDPFVVAYNHAAKKWTGPVRAGVNLMGITPDPVRNDEVDNHGKPAMMVDSKGYVHVVFGAHGGNPALGVNRFGTPAGTARGGKLTHVVSKSPQDISSWRELDNLSPFGTYPQFVQMDDGDIYLFYRHGAHRSDWVYQKSTDDGKTFAEPVSVIKHKAQQGDPAVHDSWYAWFGKGHGDTITASYVYHPCANPAHTNERTNTYFMRMNAKDDTWENAAGEKLKVSVTKEYADQKTLIENTGQERCNHGTCRVDKKGNPHLFFRYGKGQVRYSRWTGSAWTKAVPVAPGGGGQDGDLVVESPLSVRMLLTSVNGEFGELGWWKTADGGQTWAKDPPLLSKRGGGFDLGVLVENYTDEGFIIASEGRPEDYLYKRMMLVGAKGAVKRPAAEAAQIQEHLHSLRAAGVKPESGEDRAAKREKKTRKQK